MHAYPYLTSAVKLQDFFDSIRVLELPKKFTYRYLAGVGFSSSKDREFVPLLQRLGFLDLKNNPTSEYLRLKDDSDRPAALKSAIIEVYKELFAVDSAAHNVSENVLIGYFGKITERSLEETRSYVTTFKALCSLADFSNNAAPKKAEAPIISRGASTNVSLNISLPTTTDEKVYESLFKHLKEFLAPSQ